MADNDSNMCSIKEENPYQSPQIVGQKVKSSISPSDLEKNRCELRKAIRQALILQASCIVLAVIIDSLSICWIRICPLLFSPFVLLSIVFSWIETILAIIMGSISGRRYTKFDFMIVRYGFFIMMLIIYFLACLFIC
jgi:hypothetical protein